MAYANNFATVPGVPYQGNNPGGLFSAVAFRSDDPSVRWFNGVQIEGNTGGLLGTHGAFDCDNQPENIIDKSLNWESFRAFTVYGTFKCSPVGYTTDEAEQRATSRLVQFEEVSAESVFWDRLISSSNTEGVNARDLTSNDAVLAEGAVDLVTAIGLLDHYIYRNFGGGVIHVPRWLFTKLPSVSGLSQTRFTLNSGVQVVLGAGYGKPGESKTLVATPPLIGYRSDISLIGSTEQVFDRKHNELQTVAERSYLIAWDSVGDPVKITIS